jgi:hypothetical protein
MKACPFCAEEIQDAAIVCKHCGRDVAPPVASTVTAVATPSVATRSQRFRALGPILAIVGFFMTLANGTAAGFGILALWTGAALILTGGAVKRVGGGFLIAMILGSIGIAVGGNARTASGTASPQADALSTPSTPTTTPAATATPSPSLALVSARGYESDSGGFHYVEGQVTNLTDKPLQSVAAVATWYDKNDQFITSDDALVNFNPLMPGQTSPFKTITRSNPLMAKFTIQFKRLLGGQLEMRDDRKK